ncbi:malonate decarboxylase subunit alpha [Methylobacterium sp. NEAU 140]|uniref:acyl CoA:acetate/3-ketoacid CoA transferase n=1 Tax=Methylobacterium sp. NEAU 140 TaxID=3064945 RepID=UPI00273543AF|nr:malonate decarboxylase subunit alpha [Methylobacterium sp. NEAU 140]MDP4023510.1 malonate decarboxylase subunit alpha [Methylobacterium sp. NEAU 140]
MRQNKIVTADEAVALIRPDDVVTTTGFVQSCIPEALHAALERRFVETGKPGNLTLIMTAGAGDSKGLGTGRFHHEGMLGRVIAANFGRMPKVAKAAQENRIRGYNLPQGVISQLYRACAAGQPGLFTKVGLHTYVDPRHGGGRVNTLTQDEIVKVVEVDGEEWLFYRATKIDVALIRGTCADPAGNLCMSKEALTLDNLAQATAARNNGGIVIAQVERVVEQGSIKPKDVRVPGILVDCVVVAEPEHHRMNYGVQHDPALAGEVRIPVGGLRKMPLDARKVIARRAAFELPPNGVVNLGVGAPEGISAVANEEGATPYITLTTEAGAVGGVLASGSSFGAATNADCIIDQNQMFDFYDGGGLDMTCLGMAECDEAGNVNTSRFGGRLNGCGGFINISQNARKVVFAGTFTSGGLETRIEDGKLRILKEGRARKFMAGVEQNTFSGPYAKERRQPVLYVTERCVFNLTQAGMELIEVAPGIDIGRDILAHMDFMPVIENPILMDRRIFADQPMELLADILNLNLHERVSYDKERNLLFVNLEGWQVRSKGDIDALRQVLETACLKAGQRVNSIVNHDGFRIGENLYDDYAEMIEYMSAYHYLTSTRYATSAFLRLKMQEALNRRGLAPHIFERRSEAHAFLDAAIRSAETRAAAE